ncbi:hypothetical protein IKE71_02880 [Candidatus Saccharibacteria bacterium]|nr:hypothetical protein [Candidatus Saccharibacteria bacterium]
MLFVLFIVAVLLEIYLSDRKAEDMSEEVLASFMPEEYPGYRRFFESQAKQRGFLVETPHL